MGADKARADFKASKSRKDNKKPTTPPHLRRLAFIYGLCHAFTPNAREVLEISLREMGEFENFRRIFGDFSPI